jgi:RNA polymerase sigma factor (sigma-70 family)
LWDRGGIGETKQVSAGSSVRVLPSPAREVTPDEFEQRLAPTLTQLRAVLIARHGVDVGVDVHAEVASFAWERRDMVCGLENPAGYLFRVSQSKARRYRRWGRAITLPTERQVGRTEGDPRLDEAMEQLSKDERTVCVLVHGYGYRYEEAAELLGWSTASVRNRLSRAMAKLRQLLNEEDPR